MLLLLELKMELELLFMVSTWLQVTLDFNSTMLTLLVAAVRSDAMSKFCWSSSSIYVSNLSLPLF